MQGITDEVVAEYIERLERRGYSEEYVDGTLEGMSFVLEFLRGLGLLSINKNKLLREEFYVENEVSY